ncbi:MAG: VWA domain-containing protein [Vicinamibacteria bacterium]|nr:VWA domain-containing protein [Vicinamibacteria bacterium]
MSRTRFHRYLGELWNDLDLEDLVHRLGDFLLDSGFGRETGEWDEDQLQSLQEAILDSMLQGDLLPDEDLQKLLDDREALQQFLDKVTERLLREGWMQANEGRPFSDPTAGRDGDPGRPVKFELTQKASDFLGFRLLRDLLGSLGRSSIGRHDTRDLATGVEASGPTKDWEFGDTLNLDVSGTLLKAIRRGGLKDGQLDVDYRDLEVRQTEYQSSCATVVMLDCSHSMILYGEDRFTPAKKVALALSHLLRTQYPGDTLRLVLFHDSAEEVPLSQLSKVRVGPYYTNTREGLRLAQRLLQRERKDMKQIVMITDGKPSALTEPGGRIYRNPFGLDPRIVGLTLKEVANCRRQGILINTFMVAQDRELIAFVKKVTEICHGKAYFTTPYNLGQFVLMDYLNKKVRTVH